MTDILTDEELDNLGIEAIGLKNSMVFDKSRLDEIKNIVDTHFDTIATDKTIPSGHADGKLVTASGVVFHRYGGNRAKPTINTDALFSLLNKEQIWEVFNIAKIPEHEEYQLSQEKLMDALARGTIDHETLNKAMELGAWQSAKHKISLVEVEE